ncbi:WD40-repeat-containing domain protein [Limtongia smithiae]|uniref:WD40-repeat-containing domain protein n=1 Tax=Limtongia smithiae TaxID=1125753 RepID=UPI0034CFB01F
MTRSNVTTIPLFSIQPSFLDVIADVRSGKAVKDSFWVSSREVDAPTRYGSVDVYRESGQVVLRGQDGFDAVFSGQSIEVTCGEVRAQLKTPRRWIHTDCNIECFDVSPSGELYIVGGPDGELHVRSLRGSHDETLHRELKGHLSYISRALFFPSGQVALSAGGDMQIRLWSVVDGTCARTFSGHTRGVVDLALVGRGRNFLSASLDRTVSLWECGSGEMVHTFAVESEPTCLAVVNTEQATAVEERPLEFGTGDKAAVVGCADGRVCVYGLGTREELLSVATRGRVRAVAASGAHALWTASDDTVTQWDARAFRHPVATATLLTEVTGIAPLGGGVVLGTAGGCAVRWEGGHVGYFAGVDGAVGVGAGAGAVHVAQRARAVAVYDAGE